MSVVVGAAQPAIMDRQTDSTTGAAWWMNAEWRRRVRDGDDMSFVSSSSRDRMHYSWEALTVNAAGISRPICPLTDWYKTGYRAGRHEPCTFGWIYIYARGTRLIGLFTSLIIRWHQSLVTQKQASYIRAVGFRTFTPCTRRIEAAIMLGKSYHYKR